ncbi:MAG: DUF3316 domain-containing protein [Bacteroidia bacterium]|nr:DUF3316 domain-containing protein [Bacteroidia bacterium]
MRSFIARIKIRTLFFLLVCSISLSAQENTFKSTNQATLLGVGKAFLTDTYLSPLEYNGLTLSLLHDRISPTRLFNEKLILQQQFQMQVAFSKNPSASASEYFGEVTYMATGLYPFFRNNNFRFYGGAGLDTSLGGIYNVRNSNNPGSLKASANLGLSAMATYDWRRFTFRWQVSTPFAGMFFSPEYGQSYYEIFSLGNGKGTVRFASFQNQLALRNYFTVDIPINNFTIRTGYLGNYYRTDVNDIITKIVSHQFMVGFAVESLNFGGFKAKKNNRLKSSYY